MQSTKRKIYLGLGFALFLNIIFWGYSREKEAIWLNVPPVPTKVQALSVTMGDPQFAYRFFGLTLQNLGDTGGRTRHFSEYNYEKLGNWFSFLDEFDIRSNYLTFLAGYYYGSSLVPEDIEHIVDYLILAGQSGDGERWRWLAHAVFLARYHMDDLDKALEAANILADMTVDKPELPAWAKHMNSLIMIEKGQDEAALDVMLKILHSNVDNMDPSEIEFIVHHICTNILDDTAAKDFYLCNVEN